MGTKVPTYSNGSRKDNFIENTKEVGQNVSCLWSRVKGTWEFFVIFLELFCKIDMYQNYKKIKQHTSRYEVESRVLLYTKNTE